MMNRSKKIICFTGIVLLLSIAANCFFQSYYGKIVFGEVNTMIGKIYSKETQTTLLKNVENRKAEGNYTIDNPLVMINPFKTNTTALYVYFKTEEKSMVEYTVHVDNENIPDFTRTLYNSGENNLTTEHEYSP